MAAHFGMVIRSPDLQQDVVLVHGAGFKLGDLDLEKLFQISLPKRERDLLRIFMGVYAADRLVRRRRGRQETTGSREIELHVDVADPSFWSDPCTLGLLHEVLARLSNDFWSFRFQPSPVIPQQLAMLPEAPAVCQYSAGLDSAAGLCRRAATDRSPVLTVTASHQSLHGKLRDQVKQIASRYGIRVRPVFCRTRLANPPRLSRQERTQRLRGGLFTALGGAVASAVKAESVEVMENGIGAINLPPQVGMMLGAMATRSCHPGFLVAMGRLVSHVAGRPIRFELPMLGFTKAEAVRCMVDSGIEGVTQLTMSCSHWPLRHRGTAKHCGTCFACIGRRHALLAAGVSDPAAAYAVDLFGRHREELYAGPALLPLKACLMQVVDLRHWCETGAPPRAFHQHLARADVASYGVTIEQAFDLHRRYVSEWLPLIAAAKTHGLPWADWVKRVEIAA